MTLSDLLGTEPSFVTAGAALLADALTAQAAPVEPVDWLSIAIDHGARPAPRSSTRKPGRRGQPTMAPSREAARSWVVNVAVTSGP